MKWIFNDDPRHDQKRALFLFGAVVAFYVFCVIGFSVWSYFHNKKVLLSHYGTELCNSVRILDLVIGESYLDRFRPTETITTNEYRALSRRLGRFAAGCRLNELGVLFIRKNHPFVIRWESKSTDTLSEPAVPSWGPVNRGLPQAVWKAADSSSSEPVLRAISCEDDKLFYVAILYRPTGSDSGYCLYVVRNKDCLQPEFRLGLLYTIAKSFFLLLMACPLMLLYSTALQKSNRALSVLNQKLRNDVEKRKKRESELKDAIRDLERFNAITVGREKRIIELKAEVNELLKELNRPPRYQMAPSETQENGSAKNG